MKEITCMVCGKTFKTMKWNASLCSDECKLERKRQYSRQRRLMEKEYRANNPYIDNRTKTKEVRRGMKELTQDAIEARKEGLTYGKYMAKRYTSER